MRIIAIIGMEYPRRLTRHIIRLRGHLGWWRNQRPRGRTE